MNGLPAIVIAIFGVMLCAHPAIASDSALAEVGDTGEARRVSGTRLISDAEVMEAEQSRINAEISSLARRQAWSGVERHFRTMEAHGLEPGFEQYMAAAHAAHALGNLDGVYKRLRAAAQLESTREIMDWLWHIDHNFGRAQLVVHPRKADLAANVPPLDPTQRKNLSRAMSILQEKGQFNGLLPRGGYSLNGHPFEVVPGHPVAISLDRKGRLVNASAKRP